MAWHPTLTEVFVNDAHIVTVGRPQSLTHPSTGEEVWYMECRTVLMEGSNEVTQQTESMIVRKAPEQTNIGPFPTERAAQDYIDTFFVRPR